MSRGKVTYQYAHLFLDPKSSDTLRSNLHSYRDGRFEDDMYVQSFQDEFLLQVHNVGVPISIVHQMRSPSSRVAALKEIVGSSDIYHPLDRCTALARESKLADHLYFTPRGLCDYSRSEAFDGKKLTEWANLARESSTDPRDYFPEQIAAPEGSVIAFTPTYQALRDLGFLGPKDGDHYTIQGATFAERIDNFLKLYDAVTAHMEWERRTRSEQNRARRAAEDSPPIGTIPLGRLVLPSKK